ncbi:hypothetical protein BU25DRAFT_443810 [Macroventuria anomochaeta]|uniref:Uncharacterized protein n=1 Tax=Macroventuria anomochaeta TaxID=301207 RepID=A0ACB6RHY5_9PLEO|nr:uncharacterized protein BU25DRAFT_443810 [Macroventuria anomochaeta]KAF2621364.1 hypothetical protein BU25DRAFT_443810 [Macroventuria anomochaeta]
MQCFCTQSPLNILVPGSSIAGPCLAFWLHKLIPICSITILERSLVPRHHGQAVDLRLAFVPIVSKMGLLGAVRGKTTTEEGVQFVHADCRTRATFPSSGNIEAQSETSEFEVLRGGGGLARGSVHFATAIFMDATENLERVNYMFDEAISSIKEENDQIKVTFFNRLPPAHFDLVVGADGMTSRTRHLVFGRRPNTQSYSPCHAPTRYTAPRGRLLLLRPNSYGNRRTYMVVTDSNLSRFEDIDEAMRKDDGKTQEARFEKKSEGAGFVNERCVRETQKAGDYYVQQIAQVKMKSWSDGKAVLLSDAAYFPPPISGVKAQRLIPGASQVANPQTEWGVWIFNKITGVASSAIVKGLGGVVGRFLTAFGGTADFPFPEYVVSTTGGD